MRSNFYTFTFAFIVTIICALAIGGTANALRQKQQKNMRIDRYANVLKAVGLYNADKENLTQDDIEKRYNDFIIPNDVKLKSGKSKKIFYKRKFAGKKEVDTYCIEISGKGLWSTIYGYMALEKDLNTIAGLTFYQHGETPGLGGEIEKDWFTKSFKGKKIKDKSGKMVSVSIVKGKGSASDPHKVDGISGATLTGNGVDQFIRENLLDYEKVFTDILKSETAKK